jgi:hypothetical protein
MLIGNHDRPEMYRLLHPGPDHSDQGNRARHEP